jgi:hypothetical protein
MRVEISREVFDELMAWWFPGRRTEITNVQEVCTHRAPISVRGVSYYCIDRLPVPWRVIGIGRTTAGFGVTVTEPPKSGFTGATPEKPISYPVKGI